MNNHTSHRHLAPISRCRPFPLVGCECGHEVIARHPPLRLASAPLSRQERELGVRCAIRVATLAAFAAIIAAFAANRQRQLRQTRMHWGVERVRRQHDITKRQKRQYSLIQSTLLSTHNAALTCRAIFSHDRSHSGTTRSLWRTPMALAGACTVIRVPSMEVRMADGAPDRSTPY